MISFQKDGVAQPSIALDIFTELNSGEIDPETDDIMISVTGTAYAGK